MSNIAISVENLGKKYQIGEHERYYTLRDKLSKIIASPFRLFSRTRSNTSILTPNTQHLGPNNYIWALKDVSFEVEHGEIVGVIGRNGAGKTTLLKILSRITEPTEGYARINGRVASLLEVGTGFHPELTGRENIYLNGSILGMSHAEIKRKFDEIVDFAEVEKFIDTPVKRYSSGMQVRLAFSVAAHLEPEILIIDEVLAVGDAAFQKKCIGKMGDVAIKGRTVLFVSHNMAAVEKLCQRGIVLNNGNTIFIGSQSDAISKYLSSLSNNLISLKHRKDRIGTGEIKITAIDIRDSEGNFLEIIKSGQELDIYLHYELNGELSLSNILVGISFKTILDVPIFLHHNRLTMDDFGIINKKRGSFVCRLFKLPLPSAKYRVTFSIMHDLGKTGTYIDHISDAIEVTIIDGNFYDSGEVPPITHGCSLVKASWRLIA